MKNKSKTDLERIDAMLDEDIDTSDVHALDKAFFESAVIRWPEKKESITLRLDRDILEWFKKHGRGYQTRINTVLKAYVHAQGKRRRKVSTKGN